MFVEFGVLVIQSVDIQLLPGPPPASSGPSIGQRVGGFLSSLMGGAWNRCKSTVEVTLWMLLMIWLALSSGISSSLCLSPIWKFGWFWFCRRGGRASIMICDHGILSNRTLKWFEGWISYDRQGLPFCFFGKIWKDPYRDPLNHLMLGLRGTGSEQVISTFAFVEQEKRKVVAEVRQRPVGRAGSQR